MTDTRQVELSDVVTQTGRNEVGLARGVGLRVPMGPRALVGSLSHVRLGVRWRPLLTLLLFLSPTILTGLYFGLIASDRYMSTASFIVRTAAKPSTGSGLGMFLKMAGLTRSDDDTYSVQNFLLSRDAVTQLREKMPLADMYGRPGADFLARYPSFVYGKTNEELFKYYIRMTNAIYNARTGVTTLEVQAFRPDDAQTIATGLLDLSENLVNELNSRIRQDAVEANQEEVKRDETRLTDAQVAITAFQNKETMIDPVSNSVQVSTLIGKLDADLAQTQARIADMASMTPNNPGLAPLHKQEAVTKDQIERERARITSSQEGLADKLGVFQKLMLEREFATKALAAADAALTSSRIDARRKQLYIERIVSPNLSDRATLPLRGWNTFTVLMLNLLSLLLSWLLLSGFREHISSTSH